MGFFKNAIRILRNSQELENELPLINVLTRTSGRPIGFKKCHTSIIDQTYKKFRHLVSYDTDEDLIYLKSQNIDLVKVKKREYKGKLAKKGGKLNFEPYNLYCNRLLKKVKSGWIMFLDDDDMLANEKVFEEIVSFIEKADKDTMLIWKTCYPDGRQLPDERAFGSQEIKYMNIDTACFAFHSKYKKAAIWDAWRGADYRYIRDLALAIPYQKWLPMTITRKNNFGDQGKRNDLVE